MNKKTVLITVLSTVINIKKVYVEGIVRRNYDRRYLITGHTEDPGDAREFTSEQTARDVIPLLVNHHGREYKTEQLEVAESKAHPIYDEDEMS